MHIRTRPLQAEGRHGGAGREGGAGHRGHRRDRAGGGVGAGGGGGAGGAELAASPPGGGGRGAAAGPRPRGHRGRLPRGAAPRPPAPGADGPGHVRGHRHPGVQRRRQPRAGGHPGGRGGSLGQDLPGERDGGGHVGQAGGAPHGAQGGRGHRAGVVIGWVHALPGAGPLQREQGGAAGAAEGAGPGAAPPRDPNQRRGPRPHPDTIQRRAVGGRGAPPGRDVLHGHRQAGDAVGRGLGGDVPLLARRLLRGRGDRGGGRGRPLPPLGEVLGRFGRFWGHFGWIRGVSQPIKPPLIGLEAPGQDGGPHGQEEGQDGGAQWGRPSWGRPIGVNRGWAAILSPWEQPSWGCRHSNREGWAAMLEPGSHLRAWQTP